MKLKFLIICSAFSTAVSIGIANPIPSTPVDDIFAEMTTVVKR